MAEPTRWTHLPPAPPESDSPETSPWLPANLLLVLVAALPALLVVLSFATILLVAVFCVGG